MFRFQKFLVLSVFLVASAPLLSTTGQATLPLLPNERGIPTLVAFVEEIALAVVNISVVSYTSAQQIPLLHDPSIRSYFDMPQRQPSLPRMSVGSGFIVDAAQA